jgi:hypothetical protein
MDWLVTLFPHPLSPTSPTISPLDTSKETPSTAFKLPRSVLKVVLKFRSCKIFSLLLPDCPDAVSKNAPLIDGF